MSQSSPSGFPLSNIPRIRSPINYPGGKFYGAPQIIRQFPHGIDTLVSPFLGGGAIELSCAAMGIRVYGYDAFEPLVNFWQCAIEDGRRLAELVENSYPNSTLSEFYRLRNQLMLSPSMDKWECAAVYFALNRVSWAGKVFAGFRNPANTKAQSRERSILELRDFSTDMTVTLSDFNDSIRKHPNEFLYLDPPYPTGLDFYGFQGGAMHRRFNHRALAKLLHSRGNWILSYNNCELVKELYAGYEMIEPRWQQSLMPKHKSNEVLIFSPDLSPNE